MKAVTGDVKLVDGDEWDVTGADDVPTSEADQLAFEPCEVANTGGGGK